jgi:hypothetical protein
MSLTMVFMQPSCNMKFAGADCTGVQNPDICQRNKAIEAALQTLAADTTKDLGACIDEPSVECAKSALKLAATQIEMYVVQNPDLIGDFEGLKQEIKNAFPGVDTKDLENVLDALAAEITNVQNGQTTLDTDKLDALLGQVSAVLVGEKA